jgi:hypothetical protein
MLQITVKLTEELEVYIKDGVVQNNKGEIDSWYGSEITKKINLNEILEHVKGLPNGNYRISLVVERI